MGRMYKKRYLFSLIIVIVLMLAGTIIGMVYLNIQVRKTANQIQQNSYKEYERYFVLIPSDRKSSFWTAVYDGAKTVAEENNTYIEMLGTNLSEEYSQEQLMRIAMESDVDGIIVEGNESPEMKGLIDDAVAKRIPVVTALSDNAASQRQSYVGVSSYNLGREYGRKVNQISKQYFTGTKETVKKNMNVMVLVDANVEGTAQNIMYTGIQEAIENENTNAKKIHIEAKALNSQGAFAAEEAIRDIFMSGDSLPDVMICLNEINTTCAYQAVVDYNKVGVVNIIGYYDSMTILNAIKRDVIYATVTVDASEVGSNCVQALLEYNETGNVSSYFSVDTTVIDANNVENYQGGKAGEE